MDELRDEIARMIQLFDPEFGTYQELAERIMALCDREFGDDALESYRSTVLDIETRRQ